VECPGQVASQLMVQAKTVDSMVEGGEQKQQLINIECKTDFSNAPVLTVHFTYNGVFQKLQVRLPVMLTKFIEPAPMDGEQFFQRWKVLSAPTMEAQKIFKAQISMEHDAVRIKLMGAGMAILDGIDPNPDNFVCAGVLHTSLVKVGCLLRLEPNKQALMYRLTVRASKDGVAALLCDLLETQF
jgi:AP-2 complex subunit alpha